MPPMCNLARVWGDVHYTFGRPHQRGRRPKLAAYMIENTLKPALTVLAGTSLTPDTSQVRGRRTGASPGVPTYPALRVAVQRSGDEAKDCG
jgi:hypothetical protein